MMTALSFLSEQLY